MTLNQGSSITAEDTRAWDQVRDADAPQPGWWQASGGQWYPPVTDMTCGNGHPMNEEQAFCRACRAPRAEFAIESASPFDPAAVEAVADRATPSSDPTAATARSSADVTTPTSPASKRALSRLLRRTASS